VYFIANRSGKAIRADARFNVRGKAAEFWHADSGRAEPASYRAGKTGTVVPLALGANESVFVVFRRPAKAQAVTVAQPAWSQAAMLDGAWTIRFDGLTAPNAIAEGRPGSLTESTDPRVRYFSGRSIYRTTFALPSGVKSGAALKLDLGRVSDVAEVIVNGKPAGIAWKAPYKADAPLRPSGLIGPVTLRVRR
jgi:hypothetical protein